MKPEDIARILDDLGTRIGPAGEYVWQLTVKQVLIDAWLWGAFGILPFLAGIGLLVIASKTRDEVDSVLVGVLGIFGVVAGAALTVVLGTQLLNPEYHAMIRLLDSVLP